MRITVAHLAELARLMDAMKEAIASEHAGTATIPESIPLGPMSATAYRNLRVFVSTREPQGQRASALAAIGPLFEDLPPIDPTRTGRRCFG